MGIVAFILNRTIVKRKCKIKYKIEDTVIFIATKIVKWYNF